MAHQQESFLRFSSRQSLSCCLSCVAKRSTPKPHGPPSSPPKPRGPLYSPSEPHGPLFTSEPHGPLPFLQNHMVLLSFSFRTTWSSSFPIHFIRTAWTSTYLLASEPRGSPSMAAMPRLKSQHPSSFAGPFLTPPTVSYTCQHPRILPALLGCHSKSGQVWPPSMEPIISKLSHRPCNQGELLPSPILGGICFHPPGSKHGYSYLTHP